MFFCFRNFPGSNRVCRWFTPYTRIKIADWLDVAVETLVCGLRLRTANQHSLLSRHTQEIKNDRCELSCLSKIAHIVWNVEGRTWVNQT